MHIGITRIISDSWYSSKVLLVMLCIIVSALTVEISLAKTRNLTSSAPVYDFVVIIAYIVGQFYIIEFVGKKSKGLRLEGVFQSKLHKVVKGVQYILSIFLVTVFLQLLITSHYYSGILIFITTISYALAICILGLLTVQLISWLRIKKNLIVLFYSLASGSLTVSAAFTLAFVFGPFLNMPNEIQPNIQGLVYYLPILGSSEYLLNNAYNTSSIISFIMTWVATAFLLRPYSQRFGNTKYWVVVSLPLVYFLSQFPSFSLNLFAPLLNTDPVFYGILLSVIFVLSKAAGGILFGIAFWTLSSTISRDSIVRQYMIVAAAGFVLLFVSDQAPVLINAPYPPLGLASVSFFGMASYLILVGIYSSAISVAQDAKLRNSIRNLTINESKLLDTIGTAQMEQAILKRVVTLTKKNQSQMKEESGIESSLTEHDMKLYLQEVLREIEKNKQR